MRILIFFVFLFILLFKGNDYLFAGKHHSVNFTIDREIEKTQQETFTTTNRFTEIKNKDTKPDNQTEYFVSDDVEDENGNNLAARKYKLLARCYLTLPHLFIISHLNSHVKAPPPFCSHLSYKNTIQQVLRI